MRWTDLPPATPVRCIATWRAALRTRGAADAATIDVLVAEALSSPAAPRVLVEQRALEAASRHVAGSALERGGLLIGTPLSVDGTAGTLAIVHVTGAIAGVDDAATPLSLRLDATVWSRAGAKLRPSEAVVGWFHSHPGIGAFFSDTDRRTQADFFHHAFSLGWVIDPVRGEHAWFVGPQSTALPAPVVRARAAHA